MASGDGFEAATRVGAASWCAEHFLPSVGGFEQTPGTGRVDWGDRPQLTPQIRQPWEIFVDRSGSRFVAEDDPSIDRREHAVLAIDDLSFWIVFDAAIAAKAPALFPQWPAGRMQSMFGTHHAFVQADSVGELAQRCGIDAAGLEATIAAYNQSVREGSDPLGRVHLPCAIDSGPFYAIRNHGVSIKGAAGLQIDSDFHVLRQSGERIGNLYAIGELIGGGLLSGHAYVGGMSITPSLGFGRALGRTLGAGGAVGMIRSLAVAL
jgi:fumarate reductase flavoprotein subunit